MKKALFVISVIFLLFFVSCTNSVNNNSSTVKTETKTFNIGDVSIKIPKSWKYKEKFADNYFYPKNNENMFYISAEYLGIDDFGATEFTEYVSGLESAENFEKISSDTVFYDDRVFYTCTFYSDIDNSKYFIENYVSYFNENLYSFTFASKGNKRCKDFENEKTILQSIKFDKKAEKNIETGSNNKYEKVSTKELYKNNWLYDDENITTTIKVNRVYKTKEKYGYRVYNTKQYDEVKIIVENYPDKNIKKGSFITFSGFCSINDDESTITITIDAKKKEKVNKKLFKTFGGVETKPKPIPQEYLNALAQAEDYNEYIPMSKKALYDQLTSEYGGKFGNDAAQYAIDNINADWKANALSEAKTYYEDMHMSKAAVYDQLISEYGGKYTAAEAQYAVDHLDN